MWYVLTIFAVLVFDMGCVWSKQFNISMPNVRPSRDDEYLCRAFDVSDATYYLDAFSGHSPIDAAHHMILSSCELPASNKEFWNCGHMNNDGESLCNDQRVNLLYTWSSQARPINLPKDTAFKVGKGTGRNFIVLQVHYKNSNVFRKNPERTDQSGIIVKYTKKPTSKLANIYASIADGRVPNGGISFVDMACRNQMNVPMHPIAFRAHAHKHGIMNVGFRVRNNQWELIGRRSPQDEQVFYSVENPNLVIDQGDYIASRCIFENNDGEDVLMGESRSDEMCNFYILYWIPAEMEESLDDESMNICFSPGWPNYSWNETFNPLDIPKTASTDVKTGNVLYEMPLPEEDSDVLYENYPREWII